MRIIGGEFKGRRIEMPKTTGIRPTSDKVREALFNMLRGKVDKASVLDLFAGSGSLGMEALSMGAERAVFVDIQKRCVDAIRISLKGLPLRSKKADVYRSDAFKAVKKLRDMGLRFNLVFLDPPYHRNLFKKSLLTLYNYDILYHSSFIIHEHFKKELIPEEIAHFRKLRCERYGDTVLSFYIKKS